MADQASQIDRQDGDNNMQNSDNPQKPNISATVSNPVDTDGSPDATHGSMPQSVDSLLQLELKGKVSKSKDNQPRKAAASPQRRTPRTSLANEHSVEHSPLHHHHQAQILKKDGSFTPSWERKVSSASNTPGRSRLRTGGRADDSFFLFSCIQTELSAAVQKECEPEEGAAVPKFGEWDEENPSSADGFTGIFNKVREEKQTGATKVPMLTDDSVYLNNFHHQKGSKRSTICCCFNWGKK